MQLNKLKLSEARSIEKQQEKAIRKSRNYKKIFVALIIVSIICTVALVWPFFTAPSSVFKFPIQIPVPDPIKSTNDRVNILMLGMAGGNHDGALLTDSLIVASIHLKTKKTTLFSIPRDLWLDNIKQKVNAAYEIGMQKQENGLAFAKDKIDDVLGIPIHYGLRVDFDGFAKAVDLVDGISVDIPKTFDDYNYPITGKEDDLCGMEEKEIEITPDEAKILNIPPGKSRVIVNSTGKVASSAADFACRFEHIHFDQGIVDLNGETALKFVRSRMGTNGEGSDFARSRRQQLIVEAFRKKVLSLPTLVNPRKMVELLGTFSKSVETDIPTDKFLDFYNLVKGLQKTESVVLGDLGNGQSILITPPAYQYGAWVLIPKDGDFSKITDFVKQTIDRQDLPEEKKP